MPYFQIILNLNYCYFVVPERPPKTRKFKIISNQLMIHLHASCCTALLGTVEKQVNLFISH